MSPYPGFENHPRARRPQNGDILFFVGIFPLVHIVKLVAACVLSENRCDWDNSPRRDVVLDNRDSGVDMRPEKREDVRRRRSPSRRTPPSRPDLRSQNIRAVWRDSRRFHAVLSTEAVELLGTAFNLSAVPV